MGTMPAATSVVPSFSHTITPPRGVPIFRASAPPTVALPRICEVLRASASCFSSSAVVLVWPRMMAPNPSP